MRLWVSLLRVAWVCILSTSIHPVHAAEPPGDSPQVLLLAQGEARAVAPLLQAAITPHVPEATVVLVTPELTGDPQPEDVTLSVDTRNPEVWVLSLRHRDRVFVRKIRGIGQDPAAVEATAQVAAQATAALLLDAQEESSSQLQLSEWQEENPPANAAAPRNPRTRTGKKTLPETGTERRRSPLSLEVGAAYRFEPYAQNVLTHGVEGSLGLRHERGPWTGLAMSYTPPISVDSPVGSFAVTRLPIEVWFGNVFLFNAWTVAPYIAAILEPSWRGRASTQEGIAPSAPSRQFSYGLSLGVRLVWKKPRFVHLFGSASVSGYLRVPEFVAAETERDLLLPYRWRPTAELGVVFPLFGK